MDIIDESAIEIQPLSAEWVDTDLIQVDMLRLDLIHPIVSGNKWYKLKRNITHAQALGYQAILTFGGAYSNHLIATAAASSVYGLSSIGVVRGDDGGKLTETLTQCLELGMKLHFVTREQYKQKEDANWLEELGDRFDRPFIVPEGGANDWGRIGAEKISWSIPDGYTHVCVSVGTGTTFIGLRNSLDVGIELIGYVPMKQGSYLSGEIKPYLKEGRDVHWQLFDNWHFGGFGKSTDELLQFMNEFYEVNGIPLDVVYTGKMMYGVRDMLKAGYYPDGARVLCVHTGGLQGNASVREQLVYTPNP